MDTNIAKHQLSVIKNPPGWEVGVYITGALVLLGIAGVNLWKLWKSGSYPTPSPFPNYDYRYLEQKYGTTYYQIKQKRAACSFRKAGERTSPVRKPSLKMDDTFENINELGTLELMNKELELAPYGPLKKSVSTDSLSSISSIGNNFGQEFMVGQVEVNMEYNVNSNTLHVTLLQGKDLMEKEDVNFESCFVRISLLPDEQIVGISRKVQIIVIVQEPEVLVRDQKNASGQNKDVVRNQLMVRNLEDKQRYRYHVQDNRAGDMAQQDTQDNRNQMQQGSGKMQELSATPALLRQHSEAGYVDKNGPLASAVTKQQTEQFTAHFGIKHFLARCKVLVYQVVEFI
ncbi:Synaptotagmin-12 [Varanus komodoensis]|nr:Synaptotagmin-12 [Varanus komodoensis]